MISSKAAAPQPRSVSHASAAADRHSKTSRWVDAWWSRTRWRVLYKDEAIEYEFLVPKKENLEGNQEWLMSCGICQLPLRVFFFFSFWFPWPPLGFPLCFVVLLRIRGFRDPNLWIHTSNSLCVVTCLFSLFWDHLRIWCTAQCPQQWVCAQLASWARFISATDSFLAGSWPLHSCLSGQAFIDGCRTSLSVSLSLSSALKCIATSLISAAEACAIAQTSWLSPRSSTRCAIRNASVSFLLLIWLSV